MNAGHRAAFVSLSLLSAATATVTACGSSSPAGGSKGNVALADANNYTAMATLTIPVLQTAVGKDLTICWDKVMKDLLCHPVDPSTAIDNVSFAKIPMTQDQVEAKLAVGQLDTNLVNKYVDHHIDHTKNETCTMLTTLKFGGDVVTPDADYVEDASKTYLVLFETGIDPAINVKTMTVVKPTAGNDNVAVAAPDACGSHILNFAATLGQPVSIPKMGPWVVDWSGITKDAFGNPVKTSSMDKLARIDKVEVGFYQGKTAAEIQSAFVDIEVSATSLYQVAVTGGAKKVDLAGATDTTDASKTFPGFDRSDGVWLVAVIYTKNQTPAPVVLSVLTPQ